MVITNLWSHPYGTRRLGSRFMIPAEPITDFESVKGVCSIEGRLCGRLFETSSESTSSSSLETNLLENVEKPGRAKLSSRNSGSS